MANNNSSLLIFLGNRKEPSSFGIRIRTSLLKVMIGLRLSLLIGKRKNAVQKQLTLNKDEEDEFTVYTNYLNGDSSFSSFFAWQSGFASLADKIKSKNWRNLSLSDFRWLYQWLTVALLPAFLEIPNYIKELSASLGNIADRGFKHLINTSGWWAVPAIIPWFIVRSLSVAIYIPSSIASFFTHVITHVGYNYGPSPKALLTSSALISIAGASTLLGLGLGEATFSAIFGTAAFTAINALPIGWAITVFAIIAIVTTAIVVPFINSLIAHTYLSFKELLIDSNEFAHYFGLIKLPEANAQNNQSNDDNNSYEHHSDDDDVPVYNPSITNTSNSNETIYDIVLQNLTTSNIKFNKTDPAIASLGRIKDQFINLDPNDAYVTLQQREHETGLNYFLDIAFHQCYQIAKSSKEPKLIFNASKAQDDVKFKLIIVALAKKAAGLAETNLITTNTTNTYSQDNFPDTDSNYDDDDGYVTDEEEYRKNTITNNSQNISTVYNSNNVIAYKNHQVKNDETEKKLRDAARKSANALNNTNGNNNSNSNGNNNNSNQYRTPVMSNGGGGDYT